MFTTSRTKLILGSFTLTALLSSAAFAADNERSLVLEADVSHAELVKIDIPAGEVQAVGTTGNNLTAQITASCQKKNLESCRRLLKDLAWTKKTGDNLELGLSPSGITHYDDVTVKIKVGVPKDKRLEVHLSAGELHINNTSACLIASVNAGEVNITLNKSQLASAELNAKVGDVKLVTAQGSYEGERSLLVGASLKWDQGTGSCHTQASTLAGEVQLTLK